MPSPNPSRHGSTTPPSGAFSQGTGNSHVDPQVPTEGGGRDQRTLPTGERRGGGTNGMDGSRGLAPPSPTSETNLLPRGASAYAASALPIGGSHPNWMAPGGNGMWNGRQVSPRTGEISRGRTEKEETSNPENEARRPRLSTPSKESTASLSPVRPMESGPNTTLPFHSSVPRGDQRGSSPSASSPTLGTPAHPPSPPPALASLSPLHASSSGSGAMAGLGGTKLSSPSAASGARTTTGGGGGGSSATLLRSPASSFGATKPLESTPPRESRSLTRAHSTTDLLQRASASRLALEPGGWMGDGPPPSTAPPKKGFSSTSTSSSSSSSLAIGSNGRVAGMPLRSPLLASASTREWHGTTAGGSAFGRENPNRLSQPTSTHSNGGSAPLSAGSSTLFGNGSHAAGHYGSSGMSAADTLPHSRVYSHSTFVPATVSGGGGVPVGGGLYGVPNAGGSGGLPMTSAGFPSATISSSRAPKPEWLNAVNRVKVGIDGNTGGATVSTGRVRIDGVLPADQNATYGLQRHATRSITESQIRELVEQQQHPSQQSQAMGYGGGGNGSVHTSSPTMFSAAGKRNGTTGFGMGIRATAGLPPARGNTSVNKLHSPLTSGNKSISPFPTAKSTSSFPPPLVTQEVAYAAKQQQHFVPSVFTASHAGAPTSSSSYTGSVGGGWAAGPRRVHASLPTSARGTGGYGGPMAPYAPPPSGVEGGPEGGGGRWQAGPKTPSPTSQQAPEMYGGGGAYALPSTTFPPASTNNTGGRSGGEASGAGKPESSAMFPAGAAQTAWWNTARRASEVGKGSSAVGGKSTLPSISGSESSASHLAQGSSSGGSWKSILGHFGRTNSDGAGMWGMSPTKGFDAAAAGAMRDASGKPLFRSAGNGGSAVEEANNWGARYPTMDVPGTVAVEFGARSSPLRGEGGDFPGNSYSKSVGPGMSGGQGWGMGSKYGMMGNGGVKASYEKPMDSVFNVGKSSPLSLRGSSEQNRTGYYGMGVQNSAGDLRLGKEREDSGELAMVDPVSPTSFPNNNNNNNNNNNSISTSNGDKRGNENTKREGKERRKKEESTENKSTKYVSAADKEERNLRVGDFNALHAIPWEQREQMPFSAFGTRFFALLSTPRFWEKMDWTFRGSILTVVPTMILSLNPGTKELIPVPSSFAFMAFWVTMPTFGSGLREVFMLSKGYVFSGVLLLILILGIQPQKEWLSLIFLFLFTVLYSFVGDSFKKNTAYLFTSTLMEYINSPPNGLKYMVDFYVTTALSLIFAVAAFIIPFIRWSSESARHYTHVWGNVLSIGVQGTCSSFWVEKPVERELNLSHLRQLRATADMCAKKVSVSLDESEYEPHTGTYMSRMRTRYEFCQHVNSILTSMQHLLELLTDNPSRIDTPMCHSFGSLLQDDLAMISSAMDCMILKIVDFNRLVTKNEVFCFREAHENFRNAVTSVREDVILNNENYETELADVYLGYFLFSVDALCNVIASFQDEEKPKSNFTHSLFFFVRDAKAVWKHCKHLFFHLVRDQQLTRRAKEAIKLGLCMALPGFFQVYALNNESNSPLAGASVIALLYHPTGSESFHYASNRLLGTVMGSLLSLIAVEISEGTLWQLYLFMIVFSFGGAYVQAAPGFYALGNAIVCSTISIMTQYDDKSAAMERINQNCFAIFIYFAIVSILWPMRAHTKVKMSLDTSLRCIRESCTSLLRNLDMPEDAAEVSADVMALTAELQKKIAVQQKFIPGAIEEPTLGSVEFPEAQWWQIVKVERNLLSALTMMRNAYSIFMSQRADAETAISVHWVVLHRIAPFASDLADLIHAMMDLHLLQVERANIVPIAHLTRLRLAMQESNKAIIDMYIATLQRKIRMGDEMDEEEWSNSMGPYSSEPLGPNGTSASNPSSPVVSQLIPPPNFSTPWIQSGHWDGDKDGNEAGGGGGGGGSGDDGKPEGRSSSTEKPTRPPALTVEASPPPGHVDHKADATEPSPLAKSVKKDAAVHHLAVSDRPHGGHSPPSAVVTPSPRARHLPRKSIALGMEDDAADNKSIGERSSVRSLEDDESTYHPGHTRRRAGGVESGPRELADTVRRGARRGTIRGKEPGKKSVGYLTYTLTSGEEAVLRNFLQARRGGGESVVEGATHSTSVSTALPNLSFTPSVTPQMMTDVRMLAASAEDQSLAEKLRKKHKIKVDRKEKELQATEEGTKIIEMPTVGGLENGEEEGDEKSDGKDTHKGEKKSKGGLLRLGKGGSHGRKKGMDSDPTNKTSDDHEDTDAAETANTEESEVDEDGFLASPAKEDDAPGHHENGEVESSPATGKIPMSNASFLVARPFLSRLFKNSKNIKYKVDELPSTIIDAKKEESNASFFPLATSNTTEVADADFPYATPQGPRGMELSRFGRDPSEKSPSFRVEIEKETGEVEKVPCDSPRRRRSSLVTIDDDETKKFFSGSDKNVHFGTSVPIFSPQSRCLSDLFSDAGDGEHSKAVDNPNLASSKRAPFGTSMLDDATMEGSLSVTVSEMLGTSVPVASGRNVLGVPSPKNQEGSMTRMSLHEEDGGMASLTTKPPPSGTPKVPDDLHSVKDASTLVEQGVVVSKTSSKSNVSNENATPASTIDKERSTLGGELDTMKSYDKSLDDGVEDELDELTFFDGARGEFVLTNSDIHSLEAFFFGTGALVVYLDDLQRAIIDMNHQNDLNKRL